MKPGDPRLSDYWETSSLSRLVSRPVRSGVVIVSYPDDEGVRNNSGRAGARKGPGRLQHFLGKAALHPGCPPLFLLNDRLKSRSLAGRHQKAEDWVLALLSTGYRVVTMGGGHDYGFPDASAFFRVSGKRILNVDAHLDVRPVSRDINSGTPFRRFAEKHGGKHIIHWGLQPHANSSEHILWAKQNAMKCLSFKEDWPRIRSDLGLSICLDAFAGIRGVSAPTFVGPQPAQGLELVSYYAKKSSWLGIYECAPGLDPVSEDSARFGALLAYHFIYQGKLYEGRLF